MVKTPGNSGVAGLGEAENEVILQVATLGHLVRSWSTPDKVTKGIIATIVRNRSSTS